MVKKEVTGANVLVAIFGEKDSHAVYYLHQQGITRLDVVNYISHGITKTPQAPAPKPENAQNENPEQEAEATQTVGDKQSPLDQYTQNLNTLAKEGKIDPLIGREQEVERVIQVLCRRRKTTRCWLVKLVWAKLQLLKAWHGELCRVTCLKF